MNENIVCFYHKYGIILTKSIPAKKYGIKTGESLFEAR